MLESLLKRIVVGIDGSLCSDRALRWAAEEAKLRGAPLHVVHSWQFSPTPDSIEALERASKSDFASGSRDLLERAAATVAGEGLEVTTELSNDVPAAALLSAARDCELLVVGSRGRGGFKGLLLGSVSQQCAHHATCPVVIVRSADDSAKARTDSHVEREGR
ncbi:MAG: universal stress protein [Actinomycetota bacterium]